MLTAILVSLIGLDAPVATYELPPIATYAKAERCFFIACSCTDCTGSSCKCGSTVEKAKAVPNRVVVQWVLITEEHFHGKPWPAWAKNAAGFYPTLGAYLVLYSDGKMEVVDSLPMKSNYPVTPDSSPMVRVCGPNDCSLVPANRTEPFVIEDPRSVPAFGGSACQGGNCGTTRRGLFGRRR